MAIKAVIFDLGGVIIRTEDRQPRLELCQRLGLTYDQLSEQVFDCQSSVQATLGQLTTQEHWAQVLNSLRLPAEEITTFPEAFWAGDRLNMELVDFIRSLRPRYKTAALSNAWDDTRLTLREKWKILDIFDEVFLSAELHLAKPDPRIYHLAADRLNVEPEEAVFVDDFPENIDAARREGLKVVRFLNNEQALKELSVIL